MAFTIPFQRPLRVIRRRLLQDTLVSRVALGIGAASVLTLGAVFLQSDKDAPAPRATIASLAPASRLAPLAPSTAPAPSVWLSALVGPEASSFAAPQYAPMPVLPRVARPLPPLPPRERDPAATGPIIAQPVESPAEVTVAARPQSPLDEGRIGIPSAPETTVTAQTATPEQEAQEALRLAALRAPRRSLFPAARPRQLAAQIAETASVGDATASATLDPQSAPASEFAILRSRTPLRRPEAVTRLASLGPEVPLATTLAAPRAEPLAAEPLAVAPIARAIVRADRCDSALTRSIPRRSRRSEGGSDVIGQLASASGGGRDRSIIAEVMAGNIPEHLRNLVPVTFTGTGANGQDMRVTICVMPDYLAVGSDRDFVRVPLGLPAAMRVAEQFDMVLPTTRMVDAIYTQASLRLSPSPMQPGAQMSSTRYFLRHNATVEQQRLRAGGRLGQLVAGQKKDLVLTNRLNRNPGRVAIYGWHRRSGSPIQPLSTVHGAQYADYSHGVRLISRRAYVNGRAIDLRDLLADSRLAALVSSEGTITNRQMLAALR